jgi:hypothetical protein
MTAYLLENRPAWEPNTEILRSQGWTVISNFGPYCSAFKGDEEIVLMWKDGTWRRVAGKGDLPVEQK